MRRRAEIPIASLPLLLGFHQLVETMVWWGLQGRVSSGVESAATWIYLFVAFVIVPILVPVAIRAIEPTPSRRALIMPFIVIGAAVATTLLRSMLTQPVTADLETRHIAYDIGLPYGGFVVAAYVIATCGPLLLSGYRYIVVFGAINLPVIALLAFAAHTGFAFAVVRVGRGDQRGDRRPPPATAGGGSTAEVRSRPPGEVIDLGRPQRVLGFGAARPGRVPSMKLGSRSWMDPTPSSRSVRTSSWRSSSSMRVTPASPPSASP